METKTAVGFKSPSALIDEQPVALDAGALTPLVVAGMDAMALVQANVRIAQAIVEAFQARLNTRQARERRMLELQVTAARASVEIAQSAARTWQDEARLATERLRMGRRPLRRVG